MLSPDVITAFVAGALSALVVDHLVLIPLARTLWRRGWR